MLCTRAKRRALAGTALTWLLGLAATSCDPDDPCDPGYYEDHGGCYPRDAASGGDDDAGSGGDASAGGNPNATFGTPCSVQSDCGGSAPACGAPQFPVCTAIDCMNKPTNPCPATWTCLDVAKYTTDPNVTSVCVQL